MKEAIEWICEDYRTHRGSIPSEPESMVTVQRRERDVTLHCFEVEVWREGGPMFRISDSIEGDADTVKAIAEAWFRRTIAFRDFAGTFDQTTRNKEEPK